MGRKFEPVTGIAVRGESIRLTFHYLGERRRETVRLKPTAQNLRYAELKRNQILYEIEIGSFNYGDHFPESRNKDLGRRRTNLTLKQGVENWLATRVLAKSTRRGYDMSIRNYIVPKLGSRPMRGILPSELELMRAELASEHAAKTVNNALIPIRGAFEIAHADGVITTNPAIRLKNIKASRISKADPFSPAELAKLLGKAHENERNVYEFWALTGLRTGEIISVDWRDVDWEQSRIHIRRSVVLMEQKDPKTVRERFVHMDPAAIQCLKRQQPSTQLQPGGRIFVNPATNAPWDNDRVIALRWERLCKRAQVRHRPPGQLRHTYASLALSAGEAPYFVAAQLGHTSLQMLDRHYGKWMQSANPKAGENFAEVAKRFTG